MRKYLIYTLVLASLLITGCGTNINNPDNPHDSNIAFGTDGTLDIVTWNLREYPWLGESTIESLSLLIPLLKVDIIALQEINDFSALNTLAGMLPNYNVLIYTATSSYRLAYLYDIRSVEVLDEYTVFNGETNPFPRPPYVFKARWNNDDYYLINNHLKAFGDNFIDETDPWDEEYRRRLACQKLEQYISQNLGNDKVIMMGDFNDQIQEPPEYNVFMAFLNKPGEYRFADMPIALNPTFNTVSYPNSNSQIDHIMITNELYTNFESGGSVCKVLNVENWFGSWSNYNGQISDHRPLGIQLRP